MIFDAHAHAFPDSLAPHAIETLSASPRHGPIVPHTNGTVSGLRASMTAAGVRGAILCSIATKPAQVRKITDWSASLHSESPVLKSEISNPPPPASTLKSEISSLKSQISTLKSLKSEISSLKSQISNPVTSPSVPSPQSSPLIFPFASIHPDFDDPESECRRIASHGLRGIKFHPHYMNCAIDDPRTHRIARAAAAAGLAMTFHAGHDIAFPDTDLATPRALRELHDAIPTLRLQCCHLGGWKRWEESLEYLVGQPIYLETSYCLGYCPPDLLHRILTTHLPTHIQWGTDSPWQPHAADLALFRNLPIPDALKSAALSANTLRFLNLQDSS